MKNLFFVAFLALMLVSCSTSVDLAIDNPTSEPVMVKVDSLEVEVPPREVVWVEMGKGDHQITLENDSVVKFNFQEKVYMINPTLNEYLLSEEYYGSAAFLSAAESAGTIKKKKVTFLGVELEGNYDVVKGLINPVKWDYGPREVLPEMIQMDADENYALIVKMYDIPEVLASMGGGDSTGSEPVRAGDE